MQISCPKCTKIFDVNEDLIPKDGRFVQCGNCENKWFYKKQLITTSKTINKINKDKKIEKKEFKIKEKVLDTKPKIKEKNKQIKKENINLYKNYSFSEKNKKNKINYFKLLLVLVITFTAIIILVDTFKNQISIFYPDIEVSLENLFESLKDISLFLKDLIK